MTACFKKHPCPCDRVCCLRARRPDVFVNLYQSAKIEHGSGGFYITSGPQDQEDMDSHMDAYHSKAEARIKLRVCRRSIAFWLARRRNQMTHAKGCGYWSELPFFLGSRAPSFLPIWLYPSLALPHSKGNFASARCSFRTAGVVIIEVQSPRYKSGAMNPGHVHVYCQFQV